MFLQTLVPWINDVGVDVLSDPRAAGDVGPYEFSNNILTNTSK